METHEQHAAFDHVAHPSVWTRLWPGGEFVFGMLIAAAVAVYLLAFVH